MCTKSPRLLTAVFATLLLAPAQNTERAESLLGDCTSKADVDRLSCVAYLSGVLDGVVLMQKLMEQQKRAPLCLPDEGISMEQYRRIVVKWLEDRPNILHESKRIHAVKALLDAFPCKE